MVHYFWKLSIFCEFCAPALTDEVFTYKNLAIFHFEVFRTSFFLSPAEPSRNQSEGSGIDCLQSAFSLRTAVYKISSKRVHQRSCPVFSSYLHVRHSMPLSSKRCYFARAMSETDCKQPTGGKNRPTQCLFYKCENFVVWLNKTSKIL